MDVLKLSDKDLTQLFKGLSNEIERRSIKELATVPHVLYTVDYSRGKLVEVKLKKKSYAIPEDKTFTYAAPNGTLSEIDIEALLLGTGIESNVYFIKEKSS